MIRSLPYFFCAVVLAASSAFAAPKLTADEQAFFSHLSETKEFEQDRKYILAAIERLQNNLNVELELTEKEAYAVFSTETAFVGGLFRFAREKTAPRFAVRERAAGLALALRVVERYYRVARSPHATLKASELTSKTAKSVLEAVLEGFPGEKANQDSLFGILDRAEAMFQALAENSNSKSAEKLRRNDLVKDLLAKADSFGHGKTPTAFERFLAAEAELKKIARLQD